MGGCFHLTAACFEHAPHIGASVERMQQFSDELLQVLAENEVQVHAWCVLPNHYHLLVTLQDLAPCLHLLGRLHGRTSRTWNGEDGHRGRKVWCPPADRAMRSDDRFRATVNYVHHNPVRHGYVHKWRQWPFSSATAFVQTVGLAEAERLWKSWPPGDYGEGWDDPHL